MQPLGEGLKVDHDGGRHLLQPNSECQRGNENHIPRDDCLRISADRRMAERCANDLFVHSLLPGLIDNPGASRDVVDTTDFLN